MKPTDPFSPNYTPIEAKTGLSRARLPDAFLVSLYRALAPYRGCAHGCAYCDGRAEKYYVEGVFDRDISVRTNLVERVSADVAAGISSREFGAIAIGSGVTDVYQGLERELEITRKTLEKLAETGLPIVILTKSDLILRDFDILSQFSKALVIVTVTTVNETDALLLEPGASTPGQRLTVVQEAKARGFYSGIMAMPLCPGISDTDESIAPLLDAASLTGADFVYPGGLTLRPGCQKDTFLSVIDHHYPSLRAEYDDVYRENRPSGMPSSSRSGNYLLRLDRLVRARGFPQMIPHRIFRELLSPPDALFVLFGHMQSLYALRGVDTRSLKTATDAYVGWLCETRSTLRRKRVPVVSSDPFPITRVLTEKLHDMAFSGVAAKSLAKLVGNERLALLATELLEGECFFDYTSLSVVRQ